MLKEKQIPSLYNEKKECCGCSACKSICPKKAISMKADEQGFYYPVIDKEKCIECYLCIKVCPLKNRHTDYLY